MTILTAIRSDALSRSPAFTQDIEPELAPVLYGTARTNPLEQAMHLMGAAMSYPRNMEIFGDNEPAEYLYKVLSGTVRTYKILSDGRRQIGGFYLPGDIFGLEFANEHALSAEAITDVRVLVVKRSALDNLAGRDAGFARQLFAFTSRELSRMQDRVLLLIKSAQERVASFLLEMATRTPAENSIGYGNSIELPMSRQDIADYLGLTIETVSRTLTALESASAIEVRTSRRIFLRNPSALSRMNG